MKVKLPKWCQKQLEMSAWGRYILHLLLLQKDATELAELFTELYTRIPVVSQIKAQLSSLPDYSQPPA